MQSLRMLSCRVRSLRRAKSLAAYVALLVSAGAASAQGAPPTAARATPDTPAAPALALDSLSGDRLTEGSWSYVSTVTREGATVELGRRTLTVRAVEEEGRPAWLLLDETRARGQVLRDSLLVARGDFRPIRQHAEMGPMQVRLAFRGDSVVGELTVPGARGAPIALAGSGDMVVNAGMLESALTLASLAQGWTAAIHQLAVSPVGTSLVPLTLTVVGEESVTVPAGTFTAWIVDLSAAELAQRLWVDRATGRVVRTLNPAPQMPDVVYETVLVARRTAE